MIQPENKLHRLPSAGPRHFALFPHLPGTERHSSTTSPRLLWADTVCPWTTRNCWPSTAKLLAVDSELLAVDSELLGVDAELFGGDAEWRGDGKNGSKSGKKAVKTLFPAGNGQKETVEWLDLAAIISPST